MTLLLFLTLFGFPDQIDSLNTLIEKDPRADYILQLNDLYRKADRLDSGIVLLARFEPVVTAAERPSITYNLAENFLYSGQILTARDKYLETVGRYAQSDIANDALEKLYLLETARKDTVLLRRLIRALSRRAAGEPALCRDSLKILLATAVADHAGYYLGQVDEELGDPAEALAAFFDLDKNHPDHKFHRVPLWEAELCIKLGDKKKAREILENLLVRDPASVYAGPAREMLKNIGP
jgi:tetratricopeptide (TPR) repeat protein